MTTILDALPLIFLSFLTASGGALFSALALNLFFACYREHQDWKATRHHWRKDSSP